MYTLLSMTNALLRAIGNDEIPDLVFPDTDSDMAVSTIKETMVEVCSMGWWFNTEHNWNLSIDKDGQLQLPKTVLEFKTEHDLSRTILVRRGQFIYNIEEHTYDLTSVAVDGIIRMTLIMQLDLEHLPVVAQQYIRQVAMTRYLIDLEGDKLKVEVSQSNELKYLAIMDRYQLRNIRLNGYDAPRVGMVMGSLSSVNTFAGIPSNPLGSSENS